ncbi:MAG: carbon-nitrogen hydrolase family protein [Ferrimicrobium sp.]
MNVAIYQMADRGDPLENLARAYEAIVSTEADFFILPELFVLPGGDYKKDYSVAEAYRETGKPGEGMLRKASRGFAGYLIGGTLIEETADGYYNTCYVFRQGELVVKYRKINITQEEIDMQLLPGDEIVTFPTEWGQAGLLVCCDICQDTTRDQVGARSDVVFFPVGMGVPNHPKVNGHPLSAEMAGKHKVAVVEVARVGFYDGQPLVTRSAVITPSGVIWEASEEGEDLAVVDVPLNSVAHGHSWGHPTQ